MGQFVQRLRGPAFGIGKMRLENAGHVEIQRIDTLHVAIADARQAVAHGRHAQAGTRGAWRRAVAR
ncbi:hypothetical protein L1965_05990 [Paracoccus sp. EGI L200073]|nr:hypothetical protein [Paracoccus salsus]